VSKRTREEERVIGSVVSAHDPMTVLVGTESANEIGVEKHRVDLVFAGSGRRTRGREDIIVVVGGRAALVLLNFCFGLIIGIRFPFGPRD